MRQFTIVCRTAIKVGKLRAGQHRGFSAIRLGMADFGLTESEAERCIGRARDQLEEFAGLPGELLTTRMKEEMKQQENN